MLKYQILSLQLRLDFISFQIAGPSSATTITHKRKNGVVVSGSGAPGAQASQCLDDTFSVSGGDRGGSDVLCGVNTGQHSKLLVHIHIPYIVRYTF